MRFRGLRWDVGRNQISVAGIVVSACRFFFRALLSGVSDDRTGRLGSRPDVPDDPARVPDGQWRVPDDHTRVPDRYSCVHDELTRDTDGDFDFSTQFTSQ